MNISSIARSAVLTLTTIVLVSTASACGGSADTAGKTDAGTIDKATLIDAMKKKTPDLKELPASTFDCMVGVMIKYGDQPTLQGIVDGKLDVSNDFKAFGAKEKQIQREVSDCK
ncbi:hypothetical protein [Nonomuraea guangzhouensis]|uniref:DUF732 domain-containing protein n=1 Tax=Nonomuraea guangzhouensis TaxID=1291555 RepID=A0ABW4GDC8_9ACTN|nr:hypothetical protein [Nonomuraea guangzhouensis]